MSQRSTLTHFATLFVLITSTPTIVAAQRADSPAKEEVPSNIAAGRMYVRIFCSRCHGLDAKGSQAPDLTQRVLRHGNSDEALARNIRDGIPGTGMKGFAWPDKRIGQIISFLREQQRAGQPKVVPGDPAHGRVIFDKHKCDACHWTGQNGGRRGPDLSRSRGTLEYFRKVIVDPAAHVAREYHLVSLLKSDGRVVHGMRLSENSYYIQLIDEHDRLYTIAKVDVDELHRPGQSLMPNYQKDLDNLIAYLFSLREE